MLTDTATALRNSIDGEVLTPGDAAFHVARTVWNAMVDRRPRLIVRPADAQDVARAVRFARDEGLEIGVKGGGHSFTGLAVPDDGVMIDLSRMSSARVDPGARRAWVGGGAELGSLDRAAQAHGLATTAGNVSHTGVGGLTLGGGMGWLGRQLGLACDNVESYELVTADGSVVRASETENSELYWGLRGGGGNFGVVTEFVFRLHAVGTAAVVAEFGFELGEARAVLRRWAETIPDAPRQATHTSWAGRDEEGRPIFNVGYVWVGDPADGRGFASRFRRFGRPIDERVRTMTYLELQSIDDEPARHGLRRYAKGHYLRDLPDGAIDAFISAAEDTEGAAHGTLTSYSGAIAEVGPDESAFSQRDAFLEFGGSTTWADPADDDRELAAARAYGARIEPFASGVYVNVLSDEGETGVRRAYRDDQLRRLTALKSRYDPENVFHLNQNIKPG